MAVFTPLSRPEASAFLTQFALGELVEFEGISSGIEDTNFFLTTDRGRYVLTLFERLTFKQLPFYLELMRHLARRNVPVPEPQESRSGSLLSELKGKPAAIVTRLAGKAVREPTPVAPNPPRQPLRQRVGTWSQVAASSDPWGQIWKMRELKARAAARMQAGEDPVAALPAVKRELWPDEYRNQD